MNAFLCCFLRSPLTKDAVSFAEFSAAFPSMPVGVERVLVLSSFVGVREVPLFPRRWSVSDLLPGESAADGILLALTPWVGVSGGSSVVAPFSSS